MRKIFVCMLNKCGHERQVRNTTVRWKYMYAHEDFATFDGLNQEIVSFDTFKRFLSECYMAE